MNLYGFMGNSPVSTIDAFGLLVWAKLTLNDRYGTFRTSWNYQIDERFEYKVCVCDDENNPHLASATSEQVVTAKAMIESSLKGFEQEHVPYEENRVSYQGTLRVWSKYIGGSAGECLPEDEEIQVSR